MEKKIIIFGAGGHCRTILSLLSFSEFDIAGIADRTEEYLGEKIGPTEINYTWEMTDQIYGRVATNAAIALGNNDLRKLMFAQLTRIGFRIPTLVHNSSIIDPSATIGNGCHVCLGAMIGPYVAIEDNTIVYSGTIIDHETKVDKHSFISPGCKIAGRVKVGSGVFIGIGATIREKISIGNNAVVGAGAVVVEDVPDNATVAGVPARKY